MTIPNEVCTENGEWLVGSLDLGCGYEGLHTVTHWTARSRAHHYPYQLHRLTGEFWFAVLNLLMVDILKLAYTSLSFREALQMYFSQGYEKGNIKGPKPCKDNEDGSQTCTEVGFPSSIQIMDRLALL